MYNKLVAELVMGRVCMGRVGYGPSLSWAEFVMGRDVQLPFPPVTAPGEGLSIWRFTSKLFRFRNHLQIVGFTLCKTAILDR